MQRAAAGVVWLAIGEFRRLREPLWSARYFGVLATIGKVVLLYEVYGLLSLVSVIGSRYPPTVLLVMVPLGEQVHRQRQVGSVLVSAAVALIAAAW
ncbi:hypothetical protein OHB12_17560 [Nocardia sp. NBC_01730]|uniref:hypothetical protein n=1 Tax=Nocardia sp. NBC_01730 TaxID=2975998 RepID=UPI002E0F43FC|nr:hypothetical protein OHB12_17560 [Nocardia sp. NBC_01730]